MQDVTQWCFFYSDLGLHNFHELTEYAYQSSLQNIVIPLSFLISSFRDAFLLPYIQH